MKRMRSILVFWEGPLAKVQIMLAGMAVILVMIIQFLNAFGRKLLVPFPCCLEAGESLLIVVVFLGIGPVALSEEHTQVTILTRKMRPSIRRYLDAAAYAFGAVIFGIMAYGAWFVAWSMVLILEMRIGVFHFPIWPFRVLFALGLTLMTVQCVINAVRFFRQGSDPNWQPE